MFKAPPQESCVTLDVDDQHIETEQRELLGVEPRQEEIIEEAESLLPLNHQLSEKKSSRATVLSWCIATILTLLVVVAGLTRSSEEKQLVVLISLDGCRPEYLTRGLTPTLSKWGEMQGLVTGTAFWPGSEAKHNGLRATYWKKYNASTTIDEQLDWVYEWLEKPIEQRPSFLAIYISEIDHSGHLEGPDSKLVNDSLVNVDTKLQALYEGIEKRRILPQTTFVVVSDHGMAATDLKKVIFLDDYVPEKKFTTIVNGPMFYIYPYDVSGVHGYDEHNDEMKAIFIASGNMIRKSTDAVLDMFKNVEVYGLLTKLLDLEPAPNNGTAKWLSKFEKHWIQQ
ncbi:hypothetical protein HDV02_001133 [Globomyces sp. JEL0801]|nr:hypothetical protein HDV02_001133 [Globomyces sp. JEL0801]